MIDVSDSPTMSTRRILRALGARDMAALDSTRYGRYFARPSTGSGNYRSVSEREAVGVVVAAMMMGYTGQGDGRERGLSNPMAKKLRRAADAAADVVLCPGYPVPEYLVWLHRSDAVIPLSHEAAVVAVCVGHGGGRVVRVADAVEKVRAA